MKKKELIEFLKRNYSSFTAFTSSLSKEASEYSINKKWSAVMHLGHLVLSVKPLVYVFEMEKHSIAEQYGTTNDPPRSYEFIKGFYFEKLKGGGKAPKRFIPTTESPYQTAELCHGLNILVDQLSGLIERFSEEELDSLCVPHPLLGKLSLREMLYNAIYHAEHHQNLIVTMLDDESDINN
ncbi:MAG: DinB family protein [Maribacter sp.]|uniref:DinB family protein n=1 Tax=Maribacter sp. TaxID=1897614 RepID=UPI003298A2FB